MVGDVAVYERPNGRIDHTGFVLSVDRIGQTPVIRIWSAWGSLGEFAHQANVTPYRDCSISYWRLNP